MSASTQDCKASATSSGELLSGKTGPKGPPKGRSSEWNKAGAPPARGFLPHKPTPTGQHVPFLASQGYEPGVLYTSALIAQSSQGRLFTQGSATLGLLWEQWVLIHQWFSSRSSTRLCGAYWVPKPEMSWVASQNRPIRVQETTTRPFPGFRCFLGPGPDLNSDYLWMSGRSLCSQAQFIHL